MRRIETIVLRRNKEKVLVLVRGQAKIIKMEIEFQNHKKGKERKIAHLMIIHLKMLMKIWMNLVLMIIRIFRD